MLCWTWMDLSSTTIGSIQPHSSVLLKPCRIFVKLNIYLYFTFFSFRRNLPACCQSPTTSESGGDVPVHGGLPLTAPFENLQAWTPSQVRCNGRISFCFFVCVRGLIQSGWLFAVWTTSSPWRRMPSMQPTTTTSAIISWKLLWRCFWRSPGLTLCTTVPKKWKWSPRVITWQMVSTSRQTKSKYEAQSHKNSVYVDIPLFNFLNISIWCPFGHDRSIYVVDLLDHNVHVLDRKKDNSLVPVKVCKEDAGGASMSDLDFRRIVLGFFFVLVKYIFFKLFSSNLGYLNFTFKCKGQYWIPKSFWALIHTSNWKSWDQKSVTAAWSFCCVWHPSERVCRLTLWQRGGGSRDRWPVDGLSPKCNETLYVGPRRPGRFRGFSFRFFIDSLLC